MDDPSINHYEQQLYSMFKSFDVNNEESLDESAVKSLCDALQLEERGAALVDTLFEQRAGRVTFAQFRNGLLAVLGEGRVPAAPAPGGEEAASSDLAPRIAFGSKKYGRRSRPQEVAGEGEAAPPAPPAPPSPRARARRSASLAERRAPPAPPALDHDTRVTRDEALALCRGLRMRTIDARLVHRIFEDSPTPDTSVGEFFDRLNLSLATSMRESGEAGAASGDDGDAEPELEVSRLAETWEGAGVRRPRRLLADLGFVGGAVRAADLERALDDELRAFEGPLEGRAALLAAALAVSRARAAAAERRRAAAAAHRDKLRADLAGADERARLLALEVDDSHARIENDLKAGLRRAEARLAEEARRAAADAAAERERAAAERARLEGEVARRADAEARLRAEAEAERARALALEARALAAEERCAAAERRAARAEGRAAAAAGAAAAAAARAHAAAEERAAALAGELARERDRADELAAALEARPAPPAHPAAPPATPPADLSAELRSLLPPDRAEEKSERSPDELAPGGPSQGGVEPGDPSQGGVEPGDPSQGGAEPHNPSQDGASLHEPSLDDEKLKLMELVKELEGALEAMRAEYEACEEYWAGKLAGERDHHEAEARAAADRLADLVARIADFERRLAPPALAPIPEAAALEAQVAHLDAEFARYRRDARARLAALAARLARAPAPAPAPAAPAPAAPALAARCARAEALARRLAARLHAADLLVKELYVENCHLAHARPPPL